MLVRAKDKCLDKFQTNPDILKENAENIQVNWFPYDAYHGDKELQKYVRVDWFRYDINERLE